VSAAGDVSTVAVLPPTAIMLTPEMVAGFGLDPCVAGHEFWAEPVPTDVEMGRDGMLYVTSLPGGAEDDSLGANGAVYRVDPATGDVELVARGFLGATGLAVAPNGTIYVAELFAGRLSAISRSGDISTVAELEQPAAVEWQKGQLYVSTRVFGNGTIVSLRPQVS
jgi:streptogramin lyase